MEHRSFEPKIVQGKTGDEFLADLERGEETREEAAAWRVVLGVTKDVEGRGGAALLVGGSVRDELFGLPVKDFDAEVYHLPLEEIKKVAEQYGKVEEVGKSFGVLKLWVGTQSIDLSAPRRESKTGRGHKGFDVQPDPTMTVAEAVQRRDFTINALTKHPISGEVLDYVGGLRDIEQRRLRAINPKTFVEDPLRVLRGVQFAARFNLTVEPKTMALLKETRPDMKDLPKERLMEEWEKLWLRAKKPSVGLGLAYQLGLFMEYPEIQRMNETEQDKEFHPEGNVWTHSMMVVDRAAAIADRERLDPIERLPVMQAAFGHDVGKTTTTIEDRGHIRSYGHEQAGVAPMERWLTDQGFPQKVIAKVLPLIREHMNPTALYHIDQAQGLKGGPIRRLANRVHPATIKQLVAVCEADHTGRGIPTEDFPAGPWLLERAAKLSIADKKPKPIILGRDLQALGYTEGLIYGKIIKAAETLAEEKSMTGQEILELLKKHKTPEAGVAELESLLPK